MTDPLSSTRSLDPEAKHAHPPFPVSSSLARTMEHPPHTFYIHRVKQSNNLLIYSSDQKNIAYTVTGPSPSHPKAFPASLFIYRPSVSPSSSTILTAKSHDPSPDQRPLAKAVLKKYTASIRLSVNDRSINLTSRTRGPWRFAREWNSPSGVMRWHYSKYATEMELVDEKKKTLGKWEADAGTPGKLGRLWLRNPEGEKGTEWVDEVVSVGIALFVTNRRR